MQYYYKHIILGWDLAPSDESRTDQSDVMDRKTTSNCNSQSEIVNQPEVKSGSAA
jgi:hypothetical protein